MKNLILDNVLSFIENNSEDKENLKLAELRYGFESIYLLVTKSIVIFLIAYFMKILPELIILMILYNLIRMFSFGLHVTSSWVCLIASAFIFLLSSYLVKVVEINIMIKSFINIIFIILIFKNAPADTHKRPLVNAKKRTFYRFSSTIVSIIFAFTSILINNNLISNSLIFSLLIQCFMISPVVYRVLNLPYDNYRNYIKEKEV